MIKVWQPLTNYSVGDTVLSSSQNYFQYKCYHSGTSGATEPTWLETPGETLSEGPDLVWLVEEYTLDDDSYEREKFFELLPHMWKVLDENDLIERFLGVWDKAFIVSDEKIESILDSRGIETIPDRYLVLLGNLVNHNWNTSKSYDWNRQRISELITRYSYKGTDLAIKDLALEHGSAFCEIVDMASKVAVWSRQGVPEEDDCYFFDSDFFHPGVFLIYLSEDIDIESFLVDFEYQKPAGTKWLFYLQPDLLRSKVTVSSLAGIEVNLDLTTMDRIAIFNKSTYLGARQQSFLLTVDVLFDNEDVLFDSEVVLFDGTSTTLR